jgi:hypothetical protein
MFQLNTLIGDPPHSWLRERYLEYPIPTEYIIKNATFAVPKMGRCYEVDLYERGGKLLSYDDLSKLDDFNGTSHEKPVYLCEVFRDNGYDGHVIHELIGWVLISIEEFTLKGVEDLHKFINTQNDWG